MYFSIFNQTKFKSGMVKKCTDFYRVVLDYMPGLSQALRSTSLLEGLPISVSTLTCQTSQHSPWLLLRWSSDAITVNALCSTHFRVINLKKMIEKALCHSSYLNMVNGKCVDRESNTLVISFLEISSTRSKTAVVHKNTIRISLYTWNKDCMS